MGNVIEGIQQECNRCREIVVEYTALGPQGVSGRTMIEADIREGEAAIASGDVVRMIAALKALQGCE